MIAQLKERLIYIDGFNVMKNLPQLTGVKFRRGRKDFLAYVKKHRAELMMTGNIFIVFDGDERGGPKATSKSSNIRVIYSGYETADDWILRQLEKRAGNARITVVTDDQELSDRVQVHKARAVKAALFFNELLPASKRSQEEAEARKLTVQKKEEITEELMDLWCGDTEEEEW